MTALVLVLVMVIMCVLMGMFLNQVLVLVTIVLMRHLLVLMLVLMLILVMTAHFLSPPFLINFTTNRSIKRLPLAPLKLSHRRLHFPAIKVREYLNTSLSQTC
jgi:hypothetical protein